MGAAASNEPPYATPELALADGKTQEEIDTYLAANPDYQSISFEDPATIRSSI
jgi:hypothetical protein